MVTVIILGILAIVAGAGGWAYYRQADPSPMAQLQGSQEPSSDNASDAAGKLAWSFTESAPEDPMAGPQTAVMLIAEGTGRTYDLGTYAGSCSSIEATQWQLLAGEKTGAICWWAGGGTEIGIFEENGKLVVKAGDLEESTEETSGLRGNFKTLFEID